MKKIIKILKLNIKGNNANPTPPIGPTLGSVGINIMDFCKKFNDLTNNKQYKNILLPINIVIYNDKSFDIIIKKQTIKNKIINLLNIKKCSNEPKRIIIGNIDINKVKEIALYKMSDLNCFNINSAISMIIGTLKSLGVNINY
ncbi:MAG: 50S ribosomal protein L11 [Candidatus Shikimatogenerans sp. JK-2022]|nr:50S ribosomal protein L11 [Candidatus Shikimatogenerans bostrichidophilus]